MAYKFDVSVDRNDVNILFNYMNSELNVYNRLIEVFAPQFSRDYKLFLEIDNDMVELFGTMCEHSAKIYNVKPEKIHPSLEGQLHIIQNISNKIKFLFSEAISKTHIIPCIQKYMGMSILKFYIEQAENRAKNEFTKDFDIKYREIYNTLTKLSDINKKHLQIDRKSCIITYNKETMETVIKIPYSKNPIKIQGQNLKNKKWNMIILKQNFKVPLSTGGWMIELIKTTPDTYLYKKVDRLSRSYIKF
jgi:hypothetical protein